MKAAVLETTAGPESPGKTGGKAGAGSEATVVAPSSPRLRSVGGAPAEGGGDSTTPSAADDASSGAGRDVGDREQQEQESAASVGNRDREDDLLSFVAVAIALAIVAILIRKCYRFVA